MRTKLQNIVDSINLRMLSCFGLFPFERGFDTMAATEAQKRAALKWNKSRDTIVIRPDKETGAAIRAAAAAAGQSNQQYILQATQERMEGGGDPYGLDLDRINQHIEGTGETVPAFVNRAVDETIGRDNQLTAINRDMKRIKGEV